MFDQTFVDGTQKTKKPITILLSFAVADWHHRHRDSDSADLYTDATQCSIEEHVGSAAAATTTTSSSTPAREGCQGGETDSQAVCV